MVGEQGLSFFVFGFFERRLMNEEQSKISLLFPLSLSLSSLSSLSFISFFFHLVHKLRPHRRKAIVKGGGDLGPGRGRVEEGRGHREKSTSDGQVLMLYFSLSSLFREKESPAGRSRRAWGSKERQCAPASRRNESRCRVRVKESKVKTPLFSSSPKKNEREK